MAHFQRVIDVDGSSLGDGPNTVSESMVSNTGLSDFFGPDRVPGGELSAVPSAHYLCAKANASSCSQNSPSLPQKSVSSHFSETVLSKPYFAHLLFTHKRQGNQYQALLRKSPSTITIMNRTSR